MLLRGAGVRAGGLRGGARRRGGHLAGLPEAEQVFEAGEEAGQAGNDQRLDGRRNPGAVLPGGNAAAEVGDAIAEGECLMFHASDTN